MSSFGESKAMKFAKDESSAYLNYNYRQLSRVYPAGSRFDSSNYDPTPLWNAGCQLGKICNVEQLKLNIPISQYAAWELFPNSAPGDCKVGK